MQYFSSIRRIVHFSFLTVAAYMAGQRYVFAADDSSSTGGGAWVWAYILLILVLALGLMVVCKSSGRRESAKPPSYQEMNVKKTLLHD